MSTMGIRCALSEYQTVLTDSLATNLSSAQRQTEEHSLKIVTDALAELEAIRKAAKTIMTPGFRSDEEKVGAYRLLNEIRKEG